MKCASLKKCVCLIVTRETCCLRHEAPREAEDSDMSELIGNIYTSSISKFQRKEQGGKEQTFKRERKIGGGLLEKKRPLVAMRHLKNHFNNDTLLMKAEIFLNSQSCHSECSHHTENKNKTKPVLRA